MRSSSLHRRSALAAGVLAGSLALSAQAADAHPQPRVTAKVRHHTLIVQGTAAPDRLALRVDRVFPGVLDIDVNDDGRPDALVRSKRVRAIEVDAGGGDDRVRIDDANGAFTTTIPTVIDGQDGNDTLAGGAGAETFYGGAGNDVVDGNGGADTAALGNGDDTFVWDPGDGSDVVDGQAGNDAMTFNGAAVDETIRMGVNGTHALLDRDPGRVHMDLNGIERVDVNSLGGNDTLSVGDLSATDVRTVNHDEAAALGGTTPDAGSDQTIVSGTDGADAITASGQGGGASVSGLGATVNIAHAEASRDALTIDALGGDDRIDAQGLAADSVRLTADGGAGNDGLAGSAGADVLLGGDGNDTIDGNKGADVSQMGDGDDTFVWDPGDGSDTVDGQAGDDAMTFNGANVAEQFDVSANGSRVRFTRDIGTITMDLGGVERIDTNALGGADRLEVHDLTGTGVTDVATDLASTIGGAAGDGAKDVIAVDGTNAADSISASGSAGSVSVKGLATRVVVSHAEVQDDLAISALDGDDAVTGSGLAADAIHFVADGGAGNDVLTGGAGADTLLGGPGDDVLNGGPGQDTLDGGPGSNVVIQ